MWAELETGSSSAGPWTIPSASARAAGILPSAASLRALRGAGRLGARRRLLALASPRAPPPLRRRRISR